MQPRQRVGAFEIVGLLGAGGMGEVYRARDTVLEREVAIKLLPAAVGRDAARLERFAREARMLAALNHPGIASIYGIETTGSDQALILELVEGETLGSKLHRGPLPVPEAIRLAREIIDAIDAAHERNIVHRDLKPDNIMITPRGAVKVLDFGLARAVSLESSSGDGSTLTAALTAEGTVVGSAPYMSPEQARGLDQDRRTDIWSFGCVLYEMLTGRRAFAGATRSDTIAATLEREPDWTALPAPTPPGVRRLLRRCLEKDPRKRLRDIADGLPDLDDAAIVESGRPAAGRAWLPWGIAAVAVAAAAWLAWRVAQAPPAADPLAKTVLTPITRDAGSTTTPAISRDGRLVAYASDRSGVALDIWVQQIPDGLPARLTDDPADDTSPDFSPDGRQIAFRSERIEPGIYIVGALGGAPARLLIPEGRDPKFSPDGTRIAYWTGPGRGSAVTMRAQMFVASLSGGDPVRVAPSFHVARRPIWSPDGRALLFFGRADTSPPAQSLDWWIVKLDGTPPQRTGMLVNTVLREAERMPSAWTADGVLFSDGRDIWIAPIAAADGRPVGRARRLTLSAGTYDAPAASADGRIVFASTAIRRAIERTDLASPSGAPATEVHADFATLPGRPSQTRDGAIIVYERQTSTGVEVWTKHLASGVQRLVTQVKGTPLVSAVIAPDASRIAYFPFGQATTEGFAVETARGVPTRICESCSIYGFLPDGRRVLAVFGRREVRALDVTTRASTVLLTMPEGRTVDRPHISPDGRWLAFRSDNRLGSRVFVVRLTPDPNIPFDRWMPIEDPTDAGRPCGWALDSRMVYLLLDTDGFRCLWGQRLGPDGKLAGGPTPVRHFHTTGTAAMSTSFDNAVSPGGFLYGTLRTSGNIWSLDQRR
jgi:Tol biopolymer transport system component